MPSTLQSSPTGSALVEAHGERLLSRSNPDSLRRPVRQRSVFGPNN